MSDHPDCLQFTLSSHPEAVLSRMNILREERHFCDITLLLGGPVGATEHPYCFHGHKVVLAAASDFLRDQFLLHDGQAELAVSMITNVEVARKLLLSCYTGHLEVPRCELVTYLTIASALQMSPVVEKCAQAISLYFIPTLKNTSKAEEIQQTQGANTTFNQPENTHPQQQMREEDYENEKKVLELESKITTNDISNPVGLSHNVEIGTLECKLRSAANCSTSSDRDRESPDNEGRELESLQKEEDGKRELNDTVYYKQPLAELEIAISKDVLTQNTVKSPKSPNLLPKSYLCQECDHVFQHMDNYVQHIKDHHYHQCLVCEKNLPQKNALSRQVHVKPYRCPLCHGTFPDKASLQYHIHFHIGYKPHKCSYCTEQFNLKQGLRRHLKDTHWKSNLENVLEEADG
ncbi:hypothetical protein NQD34_009028 [Periophthalmus magnuspinnatus]|nr:hypothetical protein NQD34_009028 [Periophthalmus magnuspinnatus]